MFYFCETVEFAQNQTTVRLRAFNRDTFPEQYGAEQKGIPLSEEEIIDVAEEADIGHSPMAYISDNDHDELCNILEDPEKVLCKDLVSNYRLLKQSQAIKD